VLKVQLVDDRGRAIGVASMGGQRRRPVAVPRRRVRDDAVERLDSKRTLRSVQDDIAAVAVIAQLLLTLNRVRPSAAMWTLRTVIGATLADAPAALERLADPFARSLLASCVSRVTEPRSERWAAAYAIGRAPIPATGRGPVSIMDDVSFSRRMSCWLRRPARGWDAFGECCVRPGWRASAWTMGMTMTLDRHTDQLLDVEAVWAEVGASMERFVRRRVSDAHQADDVVAEVMVRIYQNLGSLDDRERLTAWVFRIARNAITDHYRRTARRREVVAAEPEAGADLGADAWLEDQAATLSELASCSRPLVDALPDDYRRALVLTDLEGHSQVDAARMEGISVSGMKSRVQRGRRQFATLVRQCCDVTTDSRGELVDFELRAEGCGCPPGP
jgi:RNA polymerase sigma-70 factor, ECF subfamily